MHDPSEILPTQLLDELMRAVPELALIGSYARDYWVHAVAGLPLVAVTLDVDVTILVASMDEYRHRLQRFEGPSGTGIVFHVLGHQVDVIPYGGVSRNGIVELAPGVTMDVTGMAESVDAAVDVHVGLNKVRIPRLSSIIALKVVAWAYRRGTTPKDARDLGPLLDATYHGPLSDALWADDAACEKWDYDDVLVGPYRAGRELHETWRSESRTHLLERISHDLRADLATQIARQGRGHPELRFEQLTALAQGVEGR